MADGVLLPAAPASYAESDLAGLADLLTSDEVNEIVINPDGAIFVEYAAMHHMVRLDRSLPPVLITSLGGHLAGEANAVLGPKAPIVSGRIRVFGQSVRVQIVAPPAIEAGVSLSIRKYISRVLDPEELRFLEGGSVDADAERRVEQGRLVELSAADDLAGALRGAIDSRLNLLISGGTSSGKTTMARALLAMTDPDERLVTIEDAAELHPPHENQVAMIAERRTGSVRSPAALLEAALRMRPDRLILGEIRGEEALSFLEAINTGHPGSISTIHADSPALALDRLALMVMRTGVQMTRDDVVNYAARTIDMVVQVGRRDGRRGVLSVWMPTAVAAAWDR